MGFLDALLCYLSLILNHFDTERDTNKNIAHVYNFYFIFYLLL